MPSRTLSSSTGDMARPRDPHPQVKESITYPLSFIIFFSVLNGTMFNVAVPDIASYFSLLPSEVSWVMTGYIVVFAVGALTYGKLADIHSVRNLITVGLVLLNAGSVVGLLSNWYPMLIAARLVQAAGGAAIPALSMLLATRYLPSDIRGKVLGIFASTVALAMGVGPVLGGFISGTFHWRYLFLTTLATAFTVPVFRRMLPREEGGGDSFDLGGAALIGGGVAALLLFVTQGLWWLLPLGAALIGLFALHIRRAESPFIRPGMFRNHPFRMTLAATFLAIGSIFGMLFMTPIMLREVNLLGSTLIGLAIFPGAMSAAFLGTWGGRLSDRKGSRFVVYLGTGIAALGFFVLSTVAGSPAWAVALGMLVTYVGFSFLQSSLPHAAAHALPREESGVGMGIYNLFFFVAGAFNAAAIGRVLDLRASGFCLNPVCTSEEAWLYSNLYLALAALMLLAAALFPRAFKATE